MAEQFSGKVAVVTGACAGIGAETVERLIARGARVVLADIMDDIGADLEQRYQGSAKYIRCNVTHEEDIVAALNLAVSAFGGLDFLFNNAGGSLGRSPMDTVSVEEWDDVQALNLRAPMLGIKHAVPLMAKRGGGSIVSTVSAAGQAAGTGGGFAYGVAKAGLIHLTRLSAVAAGQRRVRVNAVSPGVIGTAPTARATGLPMIDGHPDPRVFEIIARLQPLPQAGLPGDIAEAAIFLMSEAASFITGQTITIDGGLTLGPRHGWDPDVPNPFLEAAREVLGT